MSAQSLMGVLWLPEFQREAKTLPGRSRDATLYPEPVVLVSSNCRTSYDEQEASTADSNLCFAGTIPLSQGRQPSCGSEETSITEVNSAGKCLLRAKQQKLGPEQGRCTSSWPPNLVMCFLKGSDVDCM